MVYCPGASCGVAGVRCLAKRDNARHSRMRSMLFMDHSISRLKSVTVYSIYEKSMVASHCKNDLLASSLVVPSQKHSDAAVPVPVWMRYRRTSVGRSNQTAHSQVIHRPIAEKWTYQMWRGDTLAHGGHDTVYLQDRQKHHQVCLEDQ